jgi:hypothetical protein
MRIQKLRHVISEIIDNGTDGGWWRDRVRYRGGEVASKLRYGTGGIDVPTMDWDNLIVLDACRADLFEETIDTSQFDSYRRVTSQASRTPDWARINWGTRPHPDTIYVTANPRVSREVSGRFHKLVNVWESNFDDEDQTVHPKPVTRAACDAFRSDKRLVVHYIQPHHPFFTVPEFRYDESDWINVSDHGSEVISPWTALKNGKTTRERVWDAYQTNLHVGASEALSLASSLPGKTVITSDHGNMVGEWGWPLPLRIYDHPPEHRYPGLVRVPWATIDGQRRAISDGSIADTTEIDTDQVDKQLAALGYK